MKTAVIGSRGLSMENIGDYLPSDTTEIVSGGAKGIDTCAREYAQANGIPLTEFLPDYDRYGRAAPLRRNEQIVAYADRVIAFWDGHSRGTAYTMDLCRRCGKPLTVYSTRR